MNIRAAEDKQWWPSPPKVPGSIMEVQVKPGQSYLIHRHVFLCGTEGLELTIGFQRSLGAGIFGGDGLILQKLGGTATAWVELGGEVVTYDLAPGESLNVHPGHIGMFEESVNFDITMIPGLKNALFGNDGPAHRAFDWPRKNLAADTYDAESGACAASLYGQGSGNFTRQRWRRHRRCEW